MMDLSKHISFFDPVTNEEQIHIIGLGAIGSNLAHQLTRLGFDNLHLYDFDGIEDHNITNQMFNQEDIGMSKIVGVHKHLELINPNIKITKYSQGWTPKTELRGYIFLCLDSIELRKKVVESLMYNSAVRFVMDMRIGLSEGQMYASAWKEFEHRERLISTMQFKDDSVIVPVSACGTQLTVLPTIQMIVSVGVMNFINYIKDGTYNYHSVIDSVQGIAASYK